MVSMDLPCNIWGWWTLEPRRRINAQLPKRRSPGQDLILMYTDKILVSEGKKIGAFWQSDPLSSHTQSSVEHIHREEGCLCDVYKQTALAANQYFPIFTFNGGLSNGKSPKPFYKPFYKRVHLNVYTCVQMFSFTNRADISQGW